MDYNPRKERPFGVKGIIGGFEFIPALGIEYYVFPDLKLEYDAGFLTNLHNIGLQYHLFGNRDKPATATIGAFYLALEDADRGTTNAGGYFPLGFQYMGLNGWFVAAEIGPQTHKNINANPWFFGLGIGYHFNGLKWRK